MRDQALIELPRTFDIRLHSCRNAQAAYATANEVQEMAAQRRSQRGVVPPANAASQHGCHRGASISVLRTVLSLAVAQIVLCPTVAAATTTPSCEELVLTLGPCSTDPAGDACCSAAEVFVQDAQCLCDDAIIETVPGIEGVAGLAGACGFVAVTKDDGCNTTPGGKIQCVLLSMLIDASE